MVSLNLLGIFSPPMHNMACAQGEDFGRAGQRQYDTRIHALEHCGRAFSYLNSR
jgi:hypothetical protein